MMRRFPPVRAVLALILGLALAVAGSLHRPIDRPDQAAALAAVLALGGDAADLCHDGSGPAPHRGMADCPACTLQGGAALPPPATTLALALAGPAVRLARPAGHPARPSRDRAERPPATGPPRPFQA